RGLRRPPRRRRDRAAGLRRRAAAGRCGRAFRTRRVRRESLARGHPLACSHGSLNAMSPSPSPLPLGRPLAAALAPLALLVLAGCAPAVPMTAATDAANPECAEVIVRLPAALEDAAKQDSDNEPAGVWLKRETDAQGTGAWGNPVAVLLRCGVPV